MKAINHALTSFKPKGKSSPAIDEILQAHGPREPFPEHLRLLPTPQEKDREEEDGEIERWDDFQREINGRQEITKKLAAEFGAIYVPLQESFNKAAEQYQPAEFWLWDGIHPMPSGHELFAREWIKHVSKKLKFIR